MNDTKQYVFYKDRPEYKDITPIPQDEGERTIVKIAYPDDFTDCHDYLRALMAKDERSDRALELTTDALDLNPANYTTWAYRRNILSSLKCDLNSERDSNESIIYNNPKNYQVWHHRQWLIENIAAALEKNSPKMCELQESELEFIECNFNNDAKNYHAWQYLRWLVDLLHIEPQRQLCLMDSLLTDDAYNNSAWNHRFYVIFKDQIVTPDTLNAEFTYVKSSLEKYPGNESAWNYLYGLINPPSNVQASPLSLFEDALKFAKGLLETLKEGDRRVSLLSFLVKLYADAFMGRTSLKDCNFDTFRDEAIKLCICLKDTYDTVRRNYWQYRIRQLELIERI